MFDLSSYHEFYPLQSKLSVVPSLPPGKSEIFDDDLKSLVFSFNPEINYPDVSIKDFQIVPRKHSRNIRKLLFRERLAGKSFDSQDQNEDRASYLETNAQTLGDFGIDYKINVIHQCQRSVVWFVGQDSGDTYVKKIDCRKQWCPVCGGKGGKIHKSRLHSILSRFDVEKYNLRQFVFTVPDSVRSFFCDRDNLNFLISSVKHVIERFFGDPVFDSRGHIKRYKLKKGVIFYLHMFGERPGVFLPHVNIHILEEKGVFLKLDNEILESIKKYYLKKLRKFDKTLDVVDVHYSFRIKKRQILHAIKYMSRPWSSVDFNAIEDDNLRRLLVLDMSGFQYLRFMGDLSNCNYKDEMSLPEMKLECESKVSEHLLPVCISPFDESKWKDLIEIDIGFYRIKRKVFYYESEEAQSAPPTGAAGVDVF